MPCGMKIPLRVVQVVNVRWFNATAWYGLSLARLLKNAGHEVSVLALSGTEAFARAEEMGLSPTHIDLNSANPLSLSRSWRGMAHLVRAFSPHIVNCHRGEGVLLWGLLKQAGHRFALIRTRGDQRPPKANLPNRFLHTRLVDALIATNSRTARQCRERLGVPPERLHMIPGGVDTRRFSPDPEKRAAARQTLGFRDDSLVLGLLGRFDPVKGQRELLEAVSRLVHSSCLPASLASRIRVLLVGFSTSTSKSAVEGWIEQYRLENQTVITGKVDDVPAHINAMDIGVIASQGSEAIARAAFEIMACGVPLVGTDVGVMPDLLSARALAPVGNTEALSALLQRALLDEDFRLGLRAEQQAVIGAHSEQAFLQRTLAVYERTLHALSSTGTSNS